MGTDLPCATPEMGARQRERKRGSVFISRRLLRGLCTRLASRSAVYARRETDVNPDGRRCRTATDDVWDPVVRDFGPAHLRGKGGRGQERATMGRAWRFAREPDKNRQPVMLV